MSNNNSKQATKSANSRCTNSVYRIFILNVYTKSCYFPAFSYSMLYSSYIAKFLSIKMCVFLTSAASSILSLSLLRTLTTARTLVCLKIYVDRFAYISMTIFYLAHIYLSRYVWCAIWWCCIYQCIVYL